MSPLKTSAPQEESVELLSNCLKVNMFVVSNYETGEVYWHTEDDISDDTRIHYMLMPLKALECKITQFNINFISSEPLEKFRIVQKIMLNGQQLNQCQFVYGQVEPETDCDWDIFYSAEMNEEIMSFSFHNGNISIVTEFYDGEVFIKASVLEPYYFNF